MFHKHDAVQYTCLGIFLVLPVLLIAAVSADAPFDWHLPDGFRAPPVPAGNPMNAAKVELGRRLFYDQRMAINGKGSCSTCHLQQYAFSDQKTVAEGVTGQKHQRRAMSLANVGYFSALTWANPNFKNLEEQARTPLFGQHPVELGLSEEGSSFLRVLATEPIYQKLLPEAFPGEPRTYTFDHITRALAAFERTLISGRSPYDRYRYQGEASAISESAKQGEDLFFHQPFACFRCHGGFTFGGSTVFQSQPTPAPEYFNTGLYNLAGKSSFPPDNPGLYEFTRDAGDVGKFNPPSLRNVALRAPYMHDGSIATLDAVIDHYAAGGRTIADGPLAGDGSKNPNKSEHVHGFSITPEQRRNLIAFLQSLTDNTFIQDPNLANPWK